MRYYYSKILLLSSQGSIEYAGIELYGQGSSLAHDGAWQMLDWLIAEGARERMFLPLDYH